MIHEIGVELAAALTARCCPIRVVDGPEETSTSTYARERIVIERSGSDSFSPPRGSHTNPKHRYTRSIGVKVTIYAQAVGAGATQWEHFRRAEHILDLVLCALHAVSTARRNSLSITSGEFVGPVDLERSPVKGGVVYELRLAFDRAVLDQTWTYENRPEATLGPGGVTIINSDAITDPAHPTPETAC